MAYTTFTHDCTLTLPVGPAGGEDSIDVEVRLHCEGKPGTPERGRGYMADPAKYDPGSGPEIVLERVEIRTHPYLDIFRPALKGSPHGDDAIITAAQAYVDDLPDSLVESLTDAEDDDYDPDLHAEMRADARRVCE